MTQKSAVASYLAAEACSRAQVNVYKSAVVFDTFRAGSDVSFQKIDNQVADVATGGIFLPIKWFKV
jgi:hypothetical protein